MKCSESWLREWVNPSLTLTELSQCLTMAGLEVESITSITYPFSGVVVGEIRQIDQHPQAAQLHICHVSVNHADPLLRIVCGANNIAVGMKVPVAIVGATLSPVMQIKERVIQEVSSQGMLCSATELGLAEESEGILILPADVALGTDIRDYFNSEDHLIDIAITPNRGDCLSVRGIAREIAALTATPLYQPFTNSITVSHQERLPIHIKATAECPHYTARIIHNVKADTPTPLWIKERLRQNGIRSITAIVDITNYVMLELGQPLHAFDLQKIDTDIIVRHAHAKEKLLLLDGNEHTLTADTIVIADHHNPLAIAGVMGGLHSSVTLETTDILLESAYFLPETVAKQRQYYHLNSDSAYRFERGVDPTIQQEALDRATALILAITGGEAGPVIEKTASSSTTPKIIILRPEHIQSILGITLSTAEIEQIFQALCFDYRRNHDDWEIRVPPYRFDLSLPEDIVEEIARVYGYEKIPVQSLKGNFQVQEIDYLRDSYQLKSILRDHAYHEVITYSFIEPSLSTLFDPHAAPQTLINPITNEMAVMRTNLWPGLVSTLLYNKSRQYPRVRIFEIGTCFTIKENAKVESTRLGGLITGYAMPEQWGTPSRQVDFYDLKGDIEQLLATLFLQKACTFRPGTHEALHPGQSALIYYQEEKIGIMGALHPTVLQTLQLEENVFVFELDVAHLKIGTPTFSAISKFPEIRRDLAILINQTIPAKDIQDTIMRAVGKDWLKEVFIFDVYQGKGIEPGIKSIAVGLVFQHPTRTLVDDEVTVIMENIMTALKGQLNAVLRS